MSLPLEFTPKLFTVLKQGYSKSDFIRDAIAGVVVGIVALPLAIAFGIASGVKPEQGLYTAIVAGFLISFLSGSRVQIGGPTGAFIVIVYDIVARYGYEGLQIATIMAGAMLLVMAVCRLGSAIKFIPYPVTVGFTSGIAVIIFISQIKEFFGLRIDTIPVNFIEKISAYLEVAQTFNPWALGISLGSIMIIFYWPKMTRVIPGSLVAIVLGTLLVQCFHIPVETIADRYGAVPNILPKPSFPVVDFVRVKELFSPALTIALLAGIESLLSAVVADGMTGFRHRSNMELFSQGIANIVSPFFGGIPATGAIARTATNVKSGGRSPIAGIVHAVTLLCIMLLFAPFAGLIPMCTLAAVLVVVSYNMCEYRHFLRLLKSPIGDVAVLLLSFFLTVLVDLTAAIEVGVVLAALLFMQRMSQASNIKAISTTNEDGQEKAFINNPSLPSNSEIAVFEVTGPFFFGVAEKFSKSLSEIATPPKVLILDLEEVPFIDATALKALENLIEGMKKRKAVVILAGVQPEPLKTLKKYAILETLGEYSLAPDLEKAFVKARLYVVPVNSSN